MYGVWRTDLTCLDDSIDKLSCCHINKLGLFVEVGLRLGTGLRFEIPVVPRFEPDLIAWPSGCQSSPAAM